MDPLSIIASSITLIGAATETTKRVSRLINSISSTSEELQVLLNELQDLQIVLTSAELMIKADDRSSWPLAQASVFPILVRRTQDKLLSIESFIREFTECSPGATAQLKNLEWALRGREKARRLRDELLSLKWNFRTSISAISASSALRMGLTLDRVEVDMQRLRQEIGETSNLSQEHEERAAAATTNLTQSHDTLIRTIDTRMNEIRADVAESNTNMFFRGQLNSLLPPSAVAIHLSLQQRMMCVPDCPCVCHRWQYVNSPRLLDRLIGSLVVGFSGVPLATRKCTVSKCRLKATYALRVCYKFPTWVLSTAVTFAIYSRYGQPTAGLSLARIRPHTSTIFALAESGDVDGMKVLFDNGLASPFDISEQTGDQPLHIAADHGFIQASRLLVAYGADPHEYDTRRRNTPHQNAWNTILSGNIPRKTQNQLAALFANAHASFEFPKLHELVLGFRVGDLGTEIDKPGYDINVRDSAGNTALLWACRRGDEHATRLLLRKGADPNIPNHCYGRTPLMAACVHPSLPCIQLLLDHGADLNAQTPNGLDALIYLVEEDRDPQPMAKIVEAAKLLIAHGISLEPHGPNKAFCVTRAARNEMIDAMEVMLDNGADINSYCLGSYRLTTLARSIDWAVPRSVEFLLRRGARYTGDVQVDLEGRTILHRVALNPKLDIIKVLIEAKIVDLDPDDIDNEGLTAEDYFARHQETEEGVEPAFKHLLADLRAQLHGRENEPEVFYDTLESQNADDRISL